LDANKLKIKLAVKDFVEPDILGRKKPDWNKNTAVSPKMELRKALFNIKFGFDDAKITELSPKPVIKGCSEFRDNLSGICSLITIGWKVSYNFNQKEHKQREERLYSLTFVP